MFQNTTKRALRRGWPIHGYVGANGGGKSAAMVWDTLPSLEAGRPVLSTVRLLDYANPRECPGCDDPTHERPVYGPVNLAAVAFNRQEQELFPRVDRLGFPEREVVGWVVHRAAHPLWVKFTDWEQLLEAKSCDVLMDEVTGVASSRESASMPAPVANTLVQLRRRDVTLRWSAPAWARSDLIIRECSQSVTYCEGYLPKKAPGDGDRVWRQRRMFKWKTYDAAAFEDFTAGKREQLSAMTVDWHWGPKSPAFLAYDTFDAVSSIGTVTESGRCYRCGGTRRAPKCMCGEAHAHEAAAVPPPAGAPVGGEPEAVPLRPPGRRRAAPVVGVG